jgi:poly-beta-1,6-N-acetyl-D-glucosamine synthase
MKIVFWCFLFLIIYHYFLFPVIVYVLSMTVGKETKRGSFSPSVSLIIAAYNEEKVIEAKLENSFALEYPDDKLEIIVVSDGSNDDTPVIVRGFSDRGVIGLHDSPRRGKTSALNRAMKAAKGSIVVFSDANSMYDSKAITMLVRNFADSSVGGVCGRKAISRNQSRESSRGDELFWDFEARMKIMQGRIGSITTGDGEIFAIRKELYQIIPEEVINDDTAITFNIIQGGYRIVYEPEAFTYEEASIRLEDDFNVKARMVSGGFQTLSLYRRMLFPPKNFFALQFLSHKVLRWIMPVLLIALYISNIFILTKPYLLFFTGQSIFYGAAAAGFFLRRGSHKVRPLYLPLYYCYMNAAALKGIYFFFAGKSTTSIWKKAQR